MADETAADVLETQDGPTQVNAEESTDAAAAKAGEVEPQATATDDDDEPAKRTGGYLRKLNKAERERDFWRDEALRNRETKPAEEPADKKAPATRLKPTIEDKKPDGSAKYATFEDFNEDLTDWKVEQKLAEHQAKQQQESQQQTVKQGFAQRCAEAKKTYADFDEVAFQKTTPVTQPMQDSILESELGAEILYELGQHPEEAQRIANLPTWQAQIRAIGRLEEKLEARIAAKKSAGTEEQVEPAPSVTKAPKPPEPVRKSGPSDTGLRDDLSYKEWLRRREAELRKQ